MNYQPDLSLLTHQATCHKCSSSLPSYTISRSFITPHMENSMNLCFNTIQRFHSHLSFLAIYGSSAIFDRGGSFGIIVAGKKKTPNRRLQKEQKFPVSSAFEVVETPNAVFPLPGYAAYEVLGG